LKLLQPPLRGKTLLNFLTAPAAPPTAAFPQSLLRLPVPLPRSLPHCLPPPTLLLLLLPPPWTGKLLLNFLAAVRPVHSALPCQPPTPTAPVSAAFPQGIPRHPAPFPRPLPQRFPPQTLLLLLLPPPSRGKLLLNFLAAPAVPPTAAFPRALQRLPQPIPRPLPQRLPLPALL